MARAEAQTQSGPVGGDRGHDAPVRTVAFVSLGCPKNLVDSEKMLGLLAEDGLRPVSADPESGDGPADAVVINTCGFLEASKQESIEVIADAVRRKERGDLRRVVVAGCLVQRHRAKLLEWAPGIDAMIGVFDRDHVVRAVRGGGPGRASLEQASDGPAYWIAGNALQAARQRGRDVVGLTVRGADGKGIGYFEDDGARLRLTPRHYAFLKVSEGCNQACAFCTIPSIRGKMRSKPVDRVVREARELFDDGAFELNLIGQDTTSYGDDIGAGFRAEDPMAGGLPALLGALDAAAAERGGAWVRLMYAYPSCFADAMIDAIAELPNVVKYIDIPLQHASDSMLGAMRRNVSASAQRELIHKLRERIPGVAIRTTLISGFPGETDADHDELMRFVDEMAFEAMGVFTYSREAGTPAARMESDPGLAVPEAVKERRRDELMTLQRRIAHEQAAYVAQQHDESDPESGCRFDVLIDRVSAGPAGGTPCEAVGRAYFQAPEVDSVTRVTSAGRLAPGELVRCTVVGSDGYDYLAVPSAELRRCVSLPVLG